METQYVPDIYEEKIQILKPHLRHTTREKIRCVLVKHNGNEMQSLMYLLGETFKLNKPWPRNQKV